MTTSPTQRRHDELVALLTEIHDRLLEPEGVKAVEDGPTYITEEPPVGSQVTDREGDVWERREGGWTLWWAERSGWLADLYGDLGLWPDVRDQGPLRPTTDADRERVGLTAEPAPADVDPDEALAKVIHKVDDSDPHNWPYVKEARRGEYRSMARAAREHIEAEREEGGYNIRRAERERKRRVKAEADLADMTRQRDEVHRQAVANAEAADEWKARHAALRADVEEMRREVCRGLWPDFRGVLARDTERGDVDPDAVTISLPRDDLTKPTVLRLAAADLRRKYHLGMGGLPRSLPGTLDALADGLEEGR